MTVLLILVILVLVTISIWQLTKIFELSQPSIKDESQIANDKDNDFQGKLMFAFLGFIYILTIFSFWKWGDVILPVAASEHGSNFDSLMCVCVWYIRINIFCSDSNTSVSSLFLI